MINMVDLIFCHYFTIWLPGISRNFRNSRQEDAHEYMVNLLESMHKCSLPSGVSTESPSAYEKSFVYRIFGGRLRSQVASPANAMECLVNSEKKYLERLL